MYEDYYISDSYPTNHYSDEYVGSNSMVGSEIKALPQDKHKFFDYGWVEGD